MMDIEEISISGLKNDIEDVETKYGVSIEASRHKLKEKILPKFRKHYFKKHGLSALDILDEYNISLDGVDSYNDFEEIMDNVVEKFSIDRKSQLIRYLNFNAYHHHKIDVGISETIFDYFNGSRENYRQFLYDNITNQIVLEILTWDYKSKIEDFFEAFTEYVNIVWGLNIEYDYLEVEEGYNFRYIDDVIEAHEQFFNNRQDVFAIKMNKNGNVKVKADKDKMDEFKKLIIDNHVKKIYC